MLKQADYSKKLKQCIRLLVVSIIVIILVRLLFSMLLPYLDKTESRYGEIARIMFETHNWVTPQIDYHIPFWAKPPLSTWLSAFSYSIFGVNEFAGRFPAFILSMLTIFFVGKWALKMNKFNFLFFLFILLTTPVFLIHTSVLSTDTALSFSISLVMISFWKALNSSSENKIWGYLMFVGLGLGLLAKGPLVVVFTAPPIFFWCWQQHRFKDLLKKTPWILGIITTALISVPWYIMAERATPGFLDYFIIGEHYKRFVDPGWTGDKYGNGYQRPLGMIWIYLTLVASPWVMYVYYKSVRNIQSVLKDSWVVFLLCWFLWIPVFFSLASNTMYTYVLPIVVPGALLIVHWMKQETMIKWVKSMLILPIVMVFAAIIYLAFFPAIKYNTKSDKYLVEAWSQYQRQHTLSDSTFYSWKDRTYSSQFYTRGHALEIDDLNEFENLMQRRQPFYIAFFNEESATQPLLPYVSYFQLLKSNYERDLYLVTPDITHGLTSFEKIKQ